jgi:hypothetical protein
VEADFQREYRLDLVEALDRLTWRKFLALVAGLSPQSALVAALARRKTQDPVPVLSDPLAIAASIRAKARG